MFNSQPPARCLSFLYVQLGTVNEVLVFAPPQSGAEGGFFVLVAVNGVRQFRFKFLRIALVVIHPGIAGDNLIVMVAAGIEPQLPERQGML